MKFILGIKPTVLEGQGTTEQAINRFKHSINGWPSYSSVFGYGHVDSTRKYVYGYNIVVYKRRKHRHNKHYQVFRYRFPVEMFRLLDLEIRQGTKTFKIVPKKK